MPSASELIKSAVRGSASFPMPVEIRRVSPESQRAVLIDLFRRYLNPDFDEIRFDWLYMRNPCGTVSVWVARDPAKDAVVGAAAAFPRRFFLRGQERLGLVLGDFCLAEQYRSAGPALQLQRACLQAVAPPHDFCYDFPSPSMLAIYKRLGIQQTSSIVRWARPLRSESRLRSVVRSRTAAKVLARVGDAVLAGRGWKGKESHCDIELHAGPCDEEFTRLEEVLKCASGITAERKLDYLNWRYLGNAGSAHVILKARIRGGLAGYAVLRSDAKNTRIVDLVSAEDPGVISRLLGAAAEFSRRQGAETISLVVAQGHPWNAVFRRAGFRERESSPLVVVARADADVAPSDFQSRCYFTEGDRDS